MSNNNVHQEFPWANGYQEDFLGDGLRVALPRLSRQQQRQVAQVKDEGGEVLHYRNYSIIQNATRRLPFFTAANIDGLAFVDLSRREIFPGGRDRWRKDPRLDYAHQWGQELYGAPASDFDRGHMTRREDVQWGRDPEEARTAAQSTFYFTNSAPQHPGLNRAIWSDLEDYILHQETVGHRYRITLFTGPVLRDDDPMFVTPVRGERVQLPIYFWKVLYFTRQDGKLHRVAFLIGQKDLLEREGIVEPAPVRRDLRLPAVPSEVSFLDFKQADTYQVRVRLIEQLTEMRFQPARDPLSRRRQATVRLTLRQVEAQARGMGPTTIIEGLTL